MKEVLMKKWGKKANLSQLEKKMKTENVPQVGVFK